MVEFIKALRIYEHNDYLEAESLGSLEQPVFVIELHIDSPGSPNICAPESEMYEMNQRIKLGYWLTWVVPKRIKYDLLVRYQYQKNYTLLYIS